MEKTSNRFTVRRLAVTGLLSALVFVFSWIQIPIGEAVIWAMCSARCPACCSGP